MSRGGYLRLTPKPEEISLHQESGQQASLSFQSSSMDHIFDVNASPAPAREELPYRRPRRHDRAKETPAFTATRGQNVCRAISASYIIQLVIFGLLLAATGAEPVNDHGTFTPQHPSVAFTYWGSTVRTLGYVHLEIEVDLAGSGSRSTSPRPSSPRFMENRQADYTSFGTQKGATPTYTRWAEILYKAQIDALDQAAAQVDTASFLGHIETEGAGETIGGRARRFIAPILGFLANTFFGIYTAIEMKGIKTRLSEVEKGQAQLVLAVGRLNVKVDKNTLAIQENAQGILDATAAIQGILIHQQRTGITAVMVQEADPDGDAAVADSPSHPAAPSFPAPLHGSEPAEHPPDGLPEGRHPQPLQAPPPPHARVGRQHDHRLPRQGHDRHRSQGEGVQGPPLIRAHRVQAHGSPVHLRQQQRGPPQRRDRPQGAEPGPGPVRLLPLQGGEGSHQAGLPGAHRLPQAERTSGLSQRLLHDHHGGGGRRDQLPRRDAEDVHRERRSSKSPSSQAAPRRRPPTSSPLPWTSRSQARPGATTGPTPPSRCWGTSRSQRRTTSTGFAGATPPASRRTSRSSAPS
ncbi:unnamed protein product [Sphagnum tenellum]